MNANKPNKSNKYSRVGRRALIVFSALALTFIAQLVWWVIFQFALIDKRYDDYLNFAEARQLELISRYQGQLDFALEIIAPPDSVEDREWYQSFESALKQNSVVEALVYYDDSGLSVVIGEQSRRSVVRSGPAGRIVAHMDYRVIDSAAAAGNPKLDFYAPEELHEALTLAHFPLDSAQAASYREERDSSIRMHLAEGGFFVALIFAGLALIYRALSRSEASRRMQENFLMAVTHELKTPLASLGLSIQALRRGKIGPDKIEKANQMIDTDLVRLETLINDLLEASRDANERDAKPEQIELTAFVEQYFAARADELSQRGVDLRLLAAGTPDDSRTLFGRADLKRVLDILVDNAIKFSGAERELTVSLEKSSGGKSLSLKISDNGVGLEASELPRVFERFYRVGSELTRSRPGVGLGLYLAREITRSYGGELSAESEGLERGATFVMSLTLSEMR